MKYHRMDYVDTNGELDGISILTGINVDLEGFTSKKVICCRLASPMIHSER